MEYMLPPNSYFDGVIRIKDMAWIPNDMSNSDWKRYLEYVQEGGLTAPYSE